MLFQRIPDTLGLICRTIFVPTPEGAKPRKLSILDAPWCIYYM
jgi:hypothetical protein